MCVWRVSHCLLWTAGFDRKSIFYGHELEDRIEVCPASLPSQTGCGFSNEDIELSRPASLSSTRSSPVFADRVWHALQTSNNPTALVDVARMLLTEALKVPHNQQFLLLSDACVPLYPPQARPAFSLTLPSRLRRDPRNTLRWP